MAPEPPKRRRQNHGRRAEDRLYEVLCRDLERLRDSLRTAVGDLRDLIRQEAADVDKLEAAVAKVDQRLTDVELARIQEQARTNERAALRIEAAERRTKWSIRIGSVVGLIAIADGVSRLVGWP